jgi:hypothetical protein
VVGDKHVATLENAKARDLVARMKRETSADGTKRFDNRYNLTFSVSARNVFNNVNLAVPIGNLSSPLFGQANGLAGGPYSSSMASRRIDLQVSFNF